MGRRQKLGQHKKNSRRRRRDSLGEIHAREWEASLSRIRIPKPYLKAIKLRPLIAFERDGDGIRRYPSIAAAVNDLHARGETASVESARILIGLALSRRLRSAAGFVWRYDTETLYRMTVSVSQRIYLWQVSIKRRSIRLRFLSKRSQRPVVGFSLTDESVVRYASAAEAARDMVRRGIATQFASAAATISRTCCGRRYAALGYVWRYDLRAISLADARGPRTPQNGAITAFPVDGSPVVRYTDLNAAAEAVVAAGKASSVKTARVSICRACTGIVRVSHGCRWERERR